MNEGDRALDEWLALNLGWTNRPHPQQGTYWCDPGGAYRGFDVPEYTGRDYPLLVTALQGDPHKFEVCLWFYPAQPWAPAHCEASIWAEGKRLPIAEESADTPGLALGRAAEQALGGAE